IHITLYHHSVAQLIHPLVPPSKLEKDALYALKFSFNNSFLNLNWTGFPCPKGNNPTTWYGIACVRGHVREIRLEGMGLTGTINTDAFVFLTKLTSLSFKNNSLSGNVMDFSQNKNMKQIDLSGNKFDGPIPESLMSLDLLESLQLEDNNLTGLIPGFKQSSLKFFNVSNNNLYGPIPLTSTLQSFYYSDSFSGNPELCGPPSPDTCNNLSIKDTADTNCTIPPEAHKKSSNQTYLTIFMLFDILGLVSVVLLFILYFKKAKQLKKMMKKYEKKAESLSAADYDKDDYVVADDLGEDDQVQSSKVTEAKGKAIDTAEERGKLTFMEEESSFELNDLFKASAEGLGKGNFGHCYKAMMEGRPPVVVKRIRDLRPLTREEFTRQLIIIKDQKHPNLLPLLGYYYSKEEKLLVYKYAEKGNLFNRIHGGKGSDRIPFRWSSRLSVARGVARALEYLHTNTKSQSIVPHGNLKSTNVLIDENDMVLVSDYGLASLIAQPIASQRMVSYKSPEFQVTKRVSKKSDVWSFGCLLLEILTGRMSVHSAPPGINGVELCSWVHRAVREEWTAELFDNEISVQRGSYPGMLKLMKIALRCSESSPDKRPEMTEVVREVEGIKVVESEDESDFSVDQSLTDESLSITVSAIIADERL
ncbi:hypothetical protein Tsubulata_045370, partial [Turnera subulata]